MSDNIKLSIEDMNLFYGNFHALHDINMHIPEKEITQKIKEQIYSKPAIAVQEIGNISFEECMNKYEQKLIVSALNTCKGNISKTAEYLKINRTTLNYKIKKHNIVFGVLSSD